MVEATEGASVKMENQNQPNSQPSRDDERSRERSLAAGTPISETRPVYVPKPVKESSPRPATERQPA